MFKRHYKKSANPIFILFRLILSLVMFAVLLAGVYSAYKHFSGLDPLKLDPLSLVLKQVPKQRSDLLSQIASSKPEISVKPVFKFLALSDSHSDNNNLRKAINQAKEKYPDIQFIIGLGDYTEVGTPDELRSAKQEFDLSGLRYFVIPGDHDLWDSRDKQKQPGENFRQVFGPLYQSFTFENFLFLLLDNSDNYQGLGEEQERWIEDNLEKQEDTRGMLIFIHEPLFHPSSDHFMGRMEPKVKQQAKSLIYQLKAAGVKLVLSGDIHFFGEYSEPETNLSMVTLGAVTSERNPQAPRYVVVTVYEDGSTRVDDIEIK